MQVDILSLFPRYFEGPFSESILARAREKGLVTIRQTDIRDFAQDKHNKVDDRPYGGGPGMVLMAEPVAQAIEKVKTPDTKVVYLSPQGKTLSASHCEELARCPHLVLLCGHYEGIDQRLIDTMVDEEISIGDYVLTSGCSPAVVLLDAVMRFVPGVLGHERAAQEDSFQNGILDCPHYTRPETWRGLSVPEVLQKGNHDHINKWRHTQSMLRTQRRRPALLSRYQQELESPRQMSPSEFGLHEITLPVSKLNKSKRFYRDVLGFVLVEETDRNLILELGSLRLRLQEGTLPQEELRSRFTLGPFTEEAIQKILDRMRRAHRGQETWEANSIDKSIELLDPDAYQWTLLELK